MVQFFNESRIHAKKYSTEYKWTLKDWSLLYETVYEDRIDSDDFYLNGTNGYTCKLSLRPTNDDWPLKITFSDTLNILVIKVTVSLLNFDSFDWIHHQPIDETYHYAFPYQSLRKGHLNYVLKEINCLDDTVTLVVKITIVTSFDIVTSSNETALSLKTLSQDSKNFSSNVLSNLNEKFRSNILCDVTLELGDSKIPAHKVILAAHSKVFEAMFTNPMKEQHENDIKVIDMEVEVFKEFLNYLYTGEVTDLDKMADEILAVADYYQVSPLKTICEVYMLENLCEDNAVKYIIFGDKFSCKALKDEALHFLRQSQTLLEKALIEESSETITCLKAILKNNTVEN
ncbi:speckle-type POZ protein isoform X1 [Venturia canescens]|uniref:speckle-type POZ protein isoform X1 n=1 Tax=Venturia canescens TaxID=32260 RepID=UPI001C9D633B|nr:speckle-type POZ protein isoform X1 [Venturia canescens]XP_043268940.1 speckle-type POZ protein isoform X1 [Venturia canescens]